jgi:hypothetical protein
MVDNFPQHPIYYLKGTALFLNQPPDKIISREFTSRGKIFGVPFARGAKFVLFFLGFYGEEGF